VELGRGEELILVLRPHWIFVLIDRPWVMVAAIAAAGLGFSLGDGVVRFASAVIPVAWVLWQLAERASRTFVLTDRRVVMAAGVLRQAVVDAPLGNVRQVSLFRSIPERLLGLGTLGFATAGTGGQDLIWRHIDRPMERLRVAREALDGAGAAGGGAP
jgi:uncharacterized membrane protein YdbT with pleckstrin-like domain